MFARVRVQARTILRFSAREGMGEEQFSCHNIEIEPRHRKVGEKKKKEEKTTAKMLRGRHDEPLTIPVWPLGDGNRYFGGNIDDRTGFYHLSCDAGRGVCLVAVSPFWT